MPKVWWSTDSKKQNEIVFGRRCLPNHWWRFSIPELQTLALNFFTLSYFHLPDCMEFAWERTLVQAM